MRKDYFAMKSSRHAACIKIHLPAIDLLFRSTTSANCRANLVSVKRHN